MINSLLRDVLIENVLCLVFSKNLFVITEATVGGLILLCFDPQAIFEKKKLDGFKTELFERNIVTP